MRIDPRVIRRTKPDLEDVILPSRNSVSFFRDRDWYHVPEVGWDQPVFAIALSQVFHHPLVYHELTNKELVDMVFDSPRFYCREEMSSDSSTLVSSK